MNGSHTECFRKLVCIVRKEATSKMLLTHQELLNLILFLKNLKASKVNTEKLLSKFINLNQKLLQMTVVHMVRKRERRNSLDPKRN